MASSTAGAVTTHTVSFRITDFSTPVGSIEMQFCSNDPIPGNVCTAPTGFDINAVILSNQTGESGFIKYSTTNNRLVLSRPPVLPSAVTDSVYELSNVTNPTVAGTFFVRLRTFSSTDATGSAIQEGGIALSIEPGLTLSSEVPPYLTFCVGITIVNLDCSSANSYLIDFGELSDTKVNKASSQFVSATNAASGYTVTLSGTSLTSGNNVIPGLVTQAGVIPGTSQFGLNLRSNSNPAIGDEPAGPGAAQPTAAYGTPNLYRFNPGDPIVSIGHSSDYRKFTVSYVANISKAQSPGVYATTITYICLANF